ncbi:unnamed protein product [Penicillium camemberti]|uniref:Str. FM013 n=1 Tax=Penicillium camemberti (strain FM 013) TaxID=1429867 RepID=A0A0G4PHK2_PENC3|nr:unnamed protein product [Penicillium camemberti]
MSLGRLAGLEHGVDHILSWTLSQQHGRFSALTSVWAQHGCLIFLFRAHSEDDIMIRGKS